jgi:outer membrane protein assembly factor BamB
MFVAGWAVVAGVGADWPMYRGDARRSASTEEPLNATLQLRWTRHLPPIAAAWPNEPRLAFDTAYAPVVAGGRMLIASPAEGSLTAYDAASGEELWKYFADGPLRFAPAVARQKVFVASDDGFLHVVALADGRRLDRVRGAPADRLDYRHLGNNRLVSFWPVRGGPVIADNTVYFTAGIWPTMGVSVVAVDVDTLAVRWRNDALGYIDQVRLDHNALDHSGLSPQGYLAVEGDVLVVPNGRSMPAGIDRHTGRLRWYLQGYRNGECKLALSARYALVGRSGVVDLGTGREVGSRWAAAGADAPQAFDAKRFHLFEGPIHPYKQFAGCTARSVTSDHWAYDFESGLFTARDLEHVTISEWESKFKGGAIRPWRWDPALAWSLKSGLAGKSAADSALVRAGRRLYGHAAGRLIAVDLAADANRAPTIAWQQAVPGTPAELLAADGRLYVVTREGQISCFGAAPGAARTFALPEVQPLATRKDPWTARAGELLRAGQVDAGHCLVLGLGSGRLVDELLQQSALKLVVVEPDRQQADQARRRLIAAGLYPQRAELICAPLEPLRLPPYLASLIVSEQSWNGAGNATLTRLLDTVHPFGGAMALSISDEVWADLAAKAAGHRDRFEAHREAGLGVIRRIGAPRGSADWTHESADAARSYYSPDELVRPPLAVLWYGDGPDYGFWKEKDYGTGVKPQVVGGRVFALRITANTLFAYDAYTGRLLWQVKVSPFTRYASLDDGIYVACDGRVTVYAPATGATKAEWSFATPGQPPLVSDIRVEAQVVLVAAASQKSRAIERGLWDSTMLYVLDRQTGHVRWKRPARERFNNHSIAVSSDLLFCVDSRTPMMVSRDRRRGKVTTAPSTLLALDLGTGQIRWSNVIEYPYRTYDADSWLGAQGNDDWTAYSRELGLLVAGKQGVARAYEAATGRQLWQQKVGSQPLILRGASCVSQGGQAFDLKTGKPDGPRLPLTKGGCNYAVAGAHLLLVRDRSVSYIDFDTGGKQSLYAIRSGCSNSLIAAGGLLNVPNFAVQCVCNYPIQTSFAMFHSAAAASWLPADSSAP